MKVFVSRLVFRELVSWQSAFVFRGVRFCSLSLSFVLIIAVVVVLFYAEVWGCLIYFYLRNQPWIAKFIVKYDFLRGE